MRLIKATTPQIRSGTEQQEIEILLAVASLQFIFGQVNRAASILELIFVLSPGHAKALQMQEMIKLRPKRQ